MMLPVWFRDGKNPRPDSPFFYVVAANGTFMGKETPFWSAVVPAEKISVTENISVLEEEKPSFKLKLPPVPDVLVRSIVRFFAYISVKRHTEVMCLLWWHSKLQGGYFITIPDQEVSYVGVKYQMSRPLAGAQLVGTFHSHVDMSAYHSGTDKCDEKSIDGIHGTIGRLSKDNIKNGWFEVSIQAAINGIRFPLEPVKVLNGICAAKPELYRQPYDHPHSDGDGYRVHPYYARQSAGDNAARATYCHFTEAKPLIPGSYKPPQKWLDRLKDVSELKTMFNRTSPLGLRGLS